MGTNQVLNAYRNSEKQATIHPVKLIHMMYERVLTHLEHAEIGVKEDDPRKRGENLGKAIAIVTELNASIKQDDESEAAQFLRALYTAILVELPKVSVSKDVKILQRSYGYLKELKDVWEQTAMQEHGLLGKENEEPAEPPAEVSASPLKEVEYEPDSSKKEDGLRGLSVSI